MFIRSQTDDRRVIILDISHLFYKYAWGGASSLSVTMMDMNGQPVVVDTTLPSYSIKQVHNWALGGKNPMVVCFDSKGATVSRKGYFIKHKDVLLKNAKDDKGFGYKADRQFQNDSFYRGCEDTLRLLHYGGVMCLRGDGYEADDLICAAVAKAKEDYPNLPIDVITGDADLLPLVDDQVSVFLRSVKKTWAESPEIEKKHYVQVTPNNYQEYVQGLSSFKNLYVPYNTVLLTKLLRGDKADNVPTCPGITPKKYKKLLEDMVADGIDLATLCYYDKPTETICYRANEQPIPPELLDRIPNEQKMIKFGEPPCITRLCNILSNYLEPDQVNFVRVVYNGINLNCAYTGLGDTLNRRPAKIRDHIRGYNAANLQTAVSTYQIRLKTF